MLHIIATSTLEGKYNVSLRPYQQNIAINELKIGTILERGVIDIDDEELDKIQGLISIRSPYLLNELEQLLKETHLHHSN